MGRILKAFLKIEIYELLNHQYQPVSINPDFFEFTFEENCSAKVAFTNMWD